mgnify:CR=1 FL=1
MKKHGILHGDLSGALARLGHTDIVFVADCGLPIPPGVPVVDLALVHGIPSFQQVLDALLAEMVFQKCTAAIEAKGGDAELWLSARFENIDFTGHEELKALSASAKLIIRTGEATPFANAALTCGVPF